LVAFINNIYIILRKLKITLFEIIDQILSSRSRGLLNSILVVNETIKQVRGKNKKLIVFKVDYEK